VIDSSVGGNSDVAADEVVIPLMEVGIVGNICDIRKMAPEFDMSQELREHMAQVHGDAEEHLPMDDVTVAAQVEEEEDQPLSFQKDYVESIRPVIEMVKARIDRSTWNGHAILTHHMASMAEVDAGLEVLRTISPGIGSNLQIDSSNIKKHPELQKVLDNHTRGSPYFRQFL